MKKEWKKPQVEMLGLSNTEAMDPIILVQGQGENIEIIMDPLRAWKCPCCNQQSEYIFKTDEEVRVDFQINHVPVCKKYDATTDSCVIS